MSKAARTTASVKLRALGRSLPMELLKAREAAMARFRPMLREYGLTEQQWRVVRVLAEFGRLDAGELARRSFLLAPSLTRILQFLEGEGYVRRLADKCDHRRAYIELSARGRRVFDAVAPASEAIYADMERAFGRARMETLYALLADFSAMIDDG